MRYLTLAAAFALAACAQAPLVMNETQRSITTCHDPWSADERERAAATAEAHCQKIGESAEVSSVARCGWGDRLTAWRCAR